MGDIYLLSMMFGMDLQLYGAFTDTETGEMSGDFDVYVKPVLTEWYEGKKENCPSEIQSRKIIPGTVSPGMDEELVVFVK